MPRPISAKRRPASGSAAKGAAKNNAKTPSKPHRPSTDLISHVQQVLLQWRQTTQPADGVLAAYFKEHRELGARDRATVGDAVYAVLRERWWLLHLAKDGQGEAAAARDRRLALLALAVAQGLQQDVAKTASFGASADEQAWLSEALATPQPANLDDPMRHNLPQWLAAKLQVQMGDAAWPLAQALLQAATLDLRVNTMLAKRTPVLAALREAGLDCEETPLSPWGLRLQGKPKVTQTEAYAEGKLEVQDEGSQLLALLVDPKRAEVVADFCAGAGGKTLAMAAQMRDQGRVYAFDTNSHRLEGLQPRAKRAGVSQVYPIAIAHEADDRIKLLKGKMDRVLVDAPCSGLGTLRRSPDRKWRLTQEEAERYPALQMRILEAAAKLVKSGGRLVYATCSLLEEENEAIALAFAKANRDFELLPVQGLLEKAKVANAASLCQPLSVFGAGVPSQAPADAQAQAATDADAEFAEDWDEEDEAAAAAAAADTGVPAGQFLRLWPHLHGTDGFFAAVWQRR